MRKRVLLLVVPPVDELDLVGPAEVFGTANRLLGGGRRPYALEVVTTARDRRIDGESGLSLLAHRRYHDIDGGRSDSVLVICGVGARTMRDPALFGWLRRVAATSRRLGSVCVGAFLLAEAGILDGRRATAHWRYVRELADRYPRVAVDPRPTWVQDGNIYTSAGISAGIDLALAWVEEDFGSAAALKVARELVLFLRRPGGQDQVSVSLDTQASHTKAMHELQVWMTEHLDRSLSVDSLADRMAMSADLHFARRALGQYGPLASPDEAAAYPYTPIDRQRIAHNRKRLIVGAPAQVHARIVELVDVTKADEVMITTMVFDHAARKHSYELLAREFRLGSASGR